MDKPNKKVDKKTTNQQQYKFNDANEKKKCITEYKNYVIITNYNSEKAFI